MPVQVNRQAQRGPSRVAKADSVLDRIEPVSMPDDGMKLLVYGRGKTGKTRLASTFPKRMLLIGTEDGTRSVAGVKGLDFVRLRKSSEIGDLAAMLGTRKYSSVGLDTAGGLQDLILKEVLGLDDVPVQKSWGLTDRQTWGIVVMQFKERMRQILDLSDRHGLNVCVIAHERSFGGDDEADSDRVTQTVGAALTPSAAAWLNAACDYVCQTFIRRETKTRKQKVGGKDVEVSTETGRVEYCLRVGPHPTFLTGFRVPDGVQIPDAIVDPTHGKIVNLIRGEPF